MDVPGGGGGRRKTKAIACEVRPPITRPVAGALLHRASADARAGSLGPQSFASTSLRLAGATSSRVFQEVNCHPTNSRAAATPIEVDIDDLRNAPTTETNRDSPTKRTKWDVREAQPAAPPGTALTVEQLTTRLAAALAPVTGGLQEMQRRMSVKETK